MQVSIFPLSYYEFHLCWGSLWYSRTRNIKSCLLSLFIGMGKSHADFSSSHIARAVSRTWPCTFSCPFSQSSPLIPTKLSPSFSSFSFLSLSFILRALFILATCKWDRAAVRFVISFSSCKGHAIYWLWHAASLHPPRSSSSCPINWLFFFFGLNYELKIFT